MVGSAGDHDGSFGATLGGAIAGSLGAIGLVIATESDSVALALPAAPIAGAIIGFHATVQRRSSKRDRAHVVGSLVNIDAGDAHLGLPAIGVSKSSETASTTTMIPLIGGRI